MVLRFALLVFLTACQVTLPANIRCERGGCPEGLVCDPATQFCVDEAGDTDAATPDTSAPDGAAPDVNDDVVVPDAGPGDARGGNDTNSPDGGAPDGGPLSEAVLVFGAEGDDSVDAIAVHGNSIYVAGTSDSSMPMVLNGCNVPGDQDRGMYIARIDVSAGGLMCVWAVRLPSARVEVDAMAVNAEGLLVGGSFEGTFESEVSELGTALGRAAFLHHVDPATGASVRTSYIRSSAEDRVTAIASSGRFFCATVSIGSVGPGVLEDARVQVMPSSRLGGALLCFQSDTGAVVGGQGLISAERRPAEDLVFTSDSGDTATGELAWRQTTGGPAPDYASTVSFLVSLTGVDLGRPTGQFGLVQDRGLALALDERPDGLLMMAAGTEDSFRIAPVPATRGDCCRWEFDGSGEHLKINGMLAHQGRLHVVGEYQGSPRGVFFDGLPPSTFPMNAFWTSFAIPDEPLVTALEYEQAAQTFARDANNSVELTGIASLDSRLVIGGTLTDISSPFPTSITRVGMGSDGFIYVFSPPLP